MEQHHLTAPAELCFRRPPSSSELLCEESDGQEGQTEKHGALHTIKLEDEIKIKELKEKLQRSLKENDSANKQRIEKLKYLEKTRDTIESGTCKAIEEMRHQYHSIVNQLSCEFNKQINTASDRKREQMMKINREIERTKNDVQRMKRKEEEVKNLLQHSVSNGTIDQYKELLKGLHALQTEADTNGPKHAWKIPVYKPPPNSPPLESIEFPTHSRNFVLGYFADEDLKEEEDVKETNTESHSLKVEKIPKVHSDKSVQSVQSEKSVHSERSVHSMHSEKSGHSVYSDRSAHSFHSDKSGHSDKSYIRLVSERLPKRSVVSVGSSASEDIPPYPRHSVRFSIDSYEDSEPLRLKSFVQRPFSKLIEAPIKEANVSVDLKSYVQRKKISGAHFKTISDAVFVEYSMWVTGWNRNAFLKNDTVFINVKGPRYDVQVKEKTKVDRAESPTILSLYKDLILFTKKGGDEIFSLHTQSYEFKSCFSSPALTMAAMTCDENYIYMIDKKSPEFIRILDSKFAPCGFIASCIEGEEAMNCDIDMSVMLETRSPTSGQRDLDLPDDLPGVDVILVSKSAPNGSVRALNRTGVIWQVDSTTNPELTPKFDPCSVSASSHGDVFVADRRMERIYSVSADGLTVDYQLGKKHGIHRPSRVCVDREGRRLSVINRGGDEIRNYIINHKSN